MGRGLACRALDAARKHLASANPPERGATPPFSAASDDETGAESGATRADPLSSGAGRAELAELAAEIGRTLSGAHPRRVVNATGIPLHTNLGRAPVAPAAAAAIACCD